LLGLLLPSVFRENSSIPSIPWAAVWEVPHPIIISFSHPITSIDIFKVGSRKKFGVQNSTGNGGFITLPGKIKTFGKINDGFLRDALRHYSTIIFNSDHEY
jgi:hypothetical protein